MPEEAIPVGDTTVDAPALTSGEGTPPPSDHGSVPDAPTPESSTGDAQPKLRGADIAAELASRSGNDRPGWIPHSRHDEILANARAEGAKALQELRDKLGWAEGIPTEHVGTLQQIFGEYHNSPMALVQRIASRISPEEWRSYAARVLNEGRRPEPVADDPRPAPDVEYQGMKWYSDAQQAKLDAWNERRILAKAQELVQPLMSDREQRLRSEAEANQKAEAAQFAQTHFDSVRKLPHFEANQQDIAKEYARLNKANPPRSNEHVLAHLYGAYHSVVLPKLEVSSRQAALSHLDAKAKASTPHPTRSTTSASTPAAVDRPVADIMREEYDKLVAAR